MTRHTLSGPRQPGEIVVDESGDPSGPALVYLHSEFGAYDELPLSPALVERHRVLVVHLPGWGVSSIDQPAPTLLDLALDVWWALDRLAVDHLALVGHGLGATLAAELAAAAPGRVRSLIMVAPFGLFDDEHPGEDIFALLPHDLAPALFADPHGETARRLSPRQTDAHEAGLATIRRVQMLGAASNYLFPIPDTGISRRLYRLADVPVLLVWGELDGVVPPQLGTAWMALVPHARTVVVPGAAHMLPYETTEVSSLVEAFVSERTVQAGARA